MTCPGRVSQSVIREACVRRHQLADGQHHRRPERDMEQVSVLRACYAASTEGENAVEPLSSSTSTAVLTQVGRASRHPSRWLPLWRLTHTVHDRAYVPQPRHYDNTYIISSGSVSCARKTTRHRHCTSQPDPATARCFRRPNTCLAAT